ncbi:hypothetical protein BH10CYA1_BH10CYA1_06500 [soil metagenome]
MFDTLSPDQERLLDQLSNLMRVDAHPDGAANSAAVSSALDRVYSNIGLKAPHLIWCDGPFQLAVMPLLLQLLAFRPKDKKKDDLNIDLRVQELGALLTEPQWQAAFKRLAAQMSTTTICSLKYDDEAILPTLAELFVRFSWSRCGISAGIPLSNLLQSNTAQAVNCLAQSVTLGLSAQLTSRLYTRPIDAVQQIKRAVGHALLREQSLSLRDSPTTIFGSSRGSMTALYKRALELHQQIGGTKFERDLEECPAPQADAKYRKPRNLETDIVMNTAGLLAFGPYDTLWGAWASYPATCYAIVGDMLRDQFPKQVRSSLSDMSLLMRSGFAYVPLTRVVFICRLPEVRLDETNRLHCQDDAALQFPDGYKIFAWRGIPIPRDVIESPQSLTGQRIDQERNIELRRALIDKFGIANYLRETCAGIKDQTELGTLYLKQMPGDEPIALVRVKNSTSEVDGTYKEYFLRVPPTMKTVQEAVAWTFFLRPDQYGPSIET